MKTKTIKADKLYDLLTKLKRGQYRIDRECSFGKAVKICSYCRYVGGYWGDLEFTIMGIEEKHA
jgi:hypothetical protein